MIPSPALTLTLTAVSGCYWLLLPTCLPFLYRSYLLIDIQVIFGFFNRKPPGCDINTRRLSVSSLFF